jgi:predicted NBD/HSP70 family sugar kinase
VRPGGSLHGLRAGNRRLILEVLRRLGTASRSEIGRATGLSATTVSTLVGALLDEGVVEELPDRTRTIGRGGRPARVLAFRADAGGALGVHLAHDHIRVGLSDLAGILVATTVTELDVDNDPGGALRYAAASALDLMAAAQAPAANIVGLGVAVSAPVAASTIAPGFSRILPRWVGIDLQGELSRATGLRVVVDNDANLGALAEHRLGVARQIEDFVYVMLSDGVGAGLLLNGEIYRGALGAAGEIGHVTVARGGFVCRCGGRGCLETVAGAPALARALSLTRGSDTSLGAVIAAARDGDQGVVRVLADAGQAVGRALVPLCTVLDPSAIVIGGDYTASAEFLDSIRSETARQLPPLRTNPIPILAGALGADAELLGALSLATRTMPLHDRDGLGRDGLDRPARRAPARSSPPAKDADHDADKDADAAPA